MKSSSQFAIAVHLMAGLAFRSKEGVTTGQLAHSVNACPSFLRRTMSKLSKAGLARTSVGKSGACGLARSPEEITLLDIYRAVEPAKSVVVHDYPVQSDCAVSRSFKPALTKVLARAQESLEKDLAKTTLADFIGELR